jgi:hypothetical protein
LVAAGAMRLGPAIKPGDYILQLVITDKLAGEKNRIAVQSIDFEVR